MSKGSPIIQVRCKEDDLRRMDLQIAQRNVFTRSEPWTRSAFIITAIREKLAKMERSRRTHKKAPRPAALPV